MLILERREGQSIYIGDDVVIKVLRLQNGRTRIGIHAPKFVTILREELYAPSLLSKSIPYTETILKKRSCL